MAPFGLAAVGVTLILNACFYMDHVGETKVSSVMAQR